MSEVLAVITVSAPRRLFAVATVASLGVFLIALGMLRPPESSLARLFLVGLGVVVLLLAERMRLATAKGLELTRAELRDAAGRLLARMEDIESVDRGVFAFKPSNGFVLKLNTARSRAWAPGLWWRLGRHVGVGGVISKTEGRNMADVISALIAENRG